MLVDIFTPDQDNALYYIVLAGNVVNFENCYQNSHVDFHFFLDIYKEKNNNLVQGLRN